MQSSELETWFTRLRSGERHTLAKTLSMVESSRVDDRHSVVAILQKFPADLPASVRVGITGSPGAGKSSLIRALGLQMVNKNCGKIAIITIDPTSPHSGGSILGDKMRMHDLAGHADVFIRPLASKDALEGINTRTPEMIKIFELAGYRTIIVETLGVGQTDYGIKKIVDVIVTLVLPGSGDIIQGLKKGLNELTDVFAVSKCDGEGKDAAKTAQRSLSQALHLSAQTAQIPIILTSAVDSLGMNALSNAIDDFIIARKKTKSFWTNRESQELSLFKNEFLQLIGQHFFNQEKKLVADMEKKISREKLPPSVAAHLACAKILPGRK